MFMKIRKFLPESFQDWERGLSSVAFTQGCNYRCPSCHAKELLANSEDLEFKDQQEVLKKLRRRSRFINKLVICGGEPTLQKDLIDFIRDVKKYGIAVKLDTNGSDPETLKECLNSGLVDAVSMDVKGPRKIYGNLVGVGDNFKFENVEKSMGVVCDFPEYEFRTTIVPIREREGFRWFERKDISDISTWLIETTGSDKHPYFLQKFFTRDEKLIVHPNWAKGKIPAEYEETPNNIMEMLYSEAQKYLPNAKIR